MAWLAEQESDLKRQLEDSELKLYQYKKDRNLLAVSLDDKQSMLSQNLASVNAKLTELHIRLLEMDAKRKMIERARDNIADEENLPEIREKATIEKLRDSYLAAGQGLRGSLVALRAEHPKIKAIEGRWISIRKAYEEEIDGVLPTFEKGYQELLDNERVAASADGAAKERGHRAVEDRGRVQAAPALVRAGRQDVRHHRRPAEGDRHHRSDEDQQRPRPRARDRPGHPGAAEAGPESAPGADVRPGTGIALAFTIEALDNTLKTQADVEQFLGTPVLGLVPVIGAAPGGEAAASRATTCASAISACSSIRSRWPPSAAGRFGPTSSSCLPIGR